MIPPPLKVVKDEPTTIADVWTPNPGPQTLAARSEVFEVLYGGQAGGGKTFWLVCTGGEQATRPDYSAVIFRKTYKQLSEPDSVIPQSQRVYPEIGGVYLSGDYRWKFPNRSEIVLRHLEHSKNKYDYKGAAYIMALFDQLEDFMEDEYLYLFSRVRTVHKGFRLGVRSSANPGSEWVLRRWLPWLGTDEELEEAGLPRAKDGEPLWFKRVGDDDVLADPNDPDALSRTFIRASVYDNPYIIENDPQYIARLMALPYVERQRLLYGDWHIRAGGGMYFKREWWLAENFLSSAPAMKRLSRGWDLAASEDLKADYTANVLMGTDHSDRDWFLEAEQDRLSPLKVENLIKQKHETDPRTVVYVFQQDPGQAGKAQAYRLRAMCRGRRVMIVPAIKDKVTFAGPLSSAVESTQMMMLKGPWNAMLLSHYANFPSKDWADDIVDAGSMAYTGLTKAPRGKVVSV